MGRLGAKGAVIAGSLLSGGFSAAMAITGLWILNRSAVGGLLVSRPGAIVALVVLGFLGVLQSVIYYRIGLKNLDLARRERQKAADLEAALAQLTESDYRFRSVIENTVDVVTIKDLEGRFLLVNPAGSALLGVRPEEILGKRDIEVVEPELAKQMQEHDQAVIASGRPMTFEEFDPLPDGEHVFITTKHPYFAPDGRIAGIIGVSHDITERKRAEEALRESEARFRAILEAAPDATLLVDHDGLIRRANAESERMFGYSREELLGMSVENLMPERFRAVHVAQRGGYYAHPHHRPLRSDLDFYALTKDGREIPVEISLSPMEVEEGRFVIAALRDISQRKRHLQEIAARTAELKKSEELNRLKDHFLSSLSHEMKTPLSLICGYAELLEEKYPHEEMLKGILEGYRRLNSHISNMLDYSALVSGSLPLYMSEVNLAEIVSNAHAAVEESLRFKGLRFSTEVDPATPPLQADSRRIGQLLDELLKNAITYTPEGGALGVRVYPEGNGISLEVWDTGPGISEADQARIWSAFSQVEVGDTLRKGGLGLGLSLVKLLAERHGGSVRLASELGKGSRFIVTLPVTRSGESG